MAIACLGVSALLAFATLATGADQRVPAVKKSKYGICYDVQSPEYRRTKNFIAFVSMAECLESGGQYPKRSSTAETHNSDFDTLLSSLVRSGINGFREAEFWLQEHPKLDVTASIALALAIGFAFGRQRAHAIQRAIQNRGEVRLSRAVKTRFRPPDYHLLNHITLRLKDGTTQVDHILISRFGVFVIETKDYKGWIFAGANDRNWTQVLYRAKFRFQNPIHQNYRHVCAVRELLEFLEPGVVHSVVVFVGAAVFKTDVPDGVFTLPKFLAYVESRQTEVMSVNRAQFCVGRLEATRLAITQATDVEHVLELRRQHGIND
jgi:hypothetical protein